MATELARFATEPLAPASAQFPLPRGPHNSGDEQPSPVGVRPWNLRRMAPARFQGQPQPRGHYDPALQVRVDAEGRPLAVMGPPTAKSVTNNDGDEGPSEDWQYDYCPDGPYEV